MICCEEDRSRYRGRQELTDRLTKDRGKDNSEKIRETCKYYRTSMQVFAGEPGAGTGNLEGS